MRTLILLCALALAAPAVAGEVPSPPNFTCPGSILVVGRTGGVADPAGAFVVTARDLANNPLVNELIVVDFSLAPEFVLCPEPALPGITVDVAARRVSTRSDANGIARFIILGGTVGPAASLRGTVRILSYGVYNGMLVTNTTPLAGFICAAADLDGAGGLNANDISRLLSDIGSGNPWQRSDLDGSGALGANDLSVLLTSIGAARSTESCP